MFIPTPDPGSWIWIFFHPGTQIQGKKSTGNPDPDPEHYIFKIQFFFLVVHSSRLMCLVRKTSTYITRYMTSSCRISFGTGTGTQCNVQGA
jgi:hypothetical protein